MLLPMIALVFASVAMMVLAVAFRVNRLRQRATITDLTAWMGRLLRECAPGSVLVAEPNARDGFLQFALTESRNQWRTVEFGLPDTDWSRGSFADVQDTLAAAGLRCTIDHADADGPVRRFLRARVGGDGAEVLKILATLCPRLAAAMGYPENQTYRITILGGQSPEYRQEVDRHLNQLRKRGRFRAKLIDVIRSLPD